jgi:DNA modification methylase
LAALKLCRRFLGIEQNEVYVRLAESRIAALSI